MSSSVSAVVFGTLAKALEKSFDRAGLIEGDKHHVEATIQGSVDGVPFATSLAADMTIGHSGVRASSWSPDSAETLAYVLELVALLAKALAPDEDGRELAQGVADDVLGAFQAHGQVPASPEYLEMAKRLQSAMRKEKQNPVAGAVTVRTTQAPVLSL